MAYARRLPGRRPMDLRRLARLEAKGMARSLRSDAVPPDVALERLRAGNRRFVTGDAQVVRGWYPGLVDGQSPFAVILGCSDSRAPAEYVFDQGLGDLFVIRVAGNIVAPSLVGSIEFAANKFGTRLVVVMGHTHCGAIEATVHAMTHADGPDSRNLRSIVDRIAPHLQDLSVDGTGEDLTDEVRLAEAVRVNALASARELPTASELLRELVNQGDVKIVAAVFDLRTGVVSFMAP